MKRTANTLMAILALTFMACNNNKSSKENETSKTNADTMKMAAHDTSSMKEVFVTYNNLDPKLGSSLKDVVDHYLHIKNALVNDNGSEAAGGAKAMNEAMKKVDKSLFTSEQKKIYDDIEDDLKEHADHIGSNGSNIAHQREHFSMMSEDVYDLVKAFGAGEPLYHDHCPMANDHKGGMWLSETKEVKNPYFAGTMNECVKVMEVIR